MQLWVTLYIPLLYKTVNDWKINDPIFLKLQNGFTVEPFARKKENITLIIHYGIGNRKLNTSRQIRYTFIAERPLENNSKNKWSINIQISIKSMMMIWNLWCMVYMTQKDLNGTHMKVGDSQLLGKLKRTIQNWNDWSRG